MEFDVGLADGHLRNAARAGPDTPEGNAAPRAAKHCPEPLIFGSAFGLLTAGAAPHIFHAQCLVVPCSDRWRA